MLAPALITLLALQDASASPGIVEEPAGAATPAARRVSPGASEAEPGTTPATRPTPTPLPSPPAAGDLAVVAKSDNALAVLDAATGRLRRTVEIGIGPHEVEAMPDGKTVAVSDYGRRGTPGREVVFVDLAAGKVTGRVDLGEGARPHGLKALADGRLLVTAEGKAELVVVDPKAGKVLSRVPTGKDVSHMVAASPDGKRAYIASIGSGALTVVDLATGKVVKDVATGKGAEGIDVTPDGREIWVTNREENTISVVNAQTLAVVFTLREGEFPIRVKITPDGRRALVSFAQSGDVGVFDVTMRKLVRRIALGRDAVNGTGERVFREAFGTSPAPVGILIAPNGKRAWVAAAHADVVAVLDLENLRIEDAWRAGREPDGLAGQFSKAPPPRPTPIRKDIPRKKPPE